LIGLVAYSCSGKSEPRHHFATDAPIITGEIAQIDSLLNAHQGKWVLLNIWATWCRPCVAETPELVALGGDLRDRPFTLVGVSLDLFISDAETTAVRKVVDFAVRYGVTYPNIVFAGSVDDLTERFSLSGSIPTTILYDPRGREADRWIGALTEIDLHSIRARVS